MMRQHRINWVAVVFLATAGWGCSSQPEQPTPQGYAQQPMQPGQAYPQQPGQAYPQQPAQPAQPVQPVQPAQPNQPVQPAQNPLGGLLKTLGQAPGQVPGQVPAAGAVTHIPWQSLSQALPVSAPGWTLDGQAKGESVNVMGISVSQASCKLRQGNITAKVEIVDTSMNPMLAMPFNMARSVQIDSSEERMGPINFGTYPGTQKFGKRNNKAEVIVLVHNRVMVTVRVSNAASEAHAVGLAQYVNFAHLAKLAGG